MAGRFRIAENLLTYSLDALGDWSRCEVDSSPAIAKGSARVVIQPNYESIVVKLMKATHRHDDLDDRVVFFTTLDSIQIEYWSAGLISNVMCAVCLMAQFAHDETD